MSALSLSSGHNAALAICIRMTWPEACLAVFVFLVMIAAENALRSRRRCGAALLVHGHSQVCAKQALVSGQVSVRRYSRRRRNYEVMSTSVSGSMPASFAARSALR